MASEVVSAEVGTTSALLDACEALHARPDRAENLRRVLEADAQLQAHVAALLRERDSRKRGLALMHDAVDAQEALLKLAARMQAAQHQLADVIGRAQRTLANADEQQRGGRDVSVATLVEYAERVSYSNAAPCGPVAFAGAERNTFYHGWGTPTPQQHMVGASRFASREPDEVEPPAAAESEAVAAAADKEASAAASAPSFTAVKPAAAAPTAGSKANVSLSLGSDDEDEDDFDDDDDDFL